jgi:hypothetical protein
MIDLVYIFWLCVLSVWVLFMKKGPKGNDGVTPDSSYYLSEWDVRKILMQNIDDPEFIVKLIAKLNALQLHKGDKHDNE